MNVKELTDKQLSDQLKGKGVLVGPIVGSTRRLYESMLERFLAEEEVTPGMPKRVTRKSSKEGSPIAASPAMSGPFKIPPIPKSEDLHQSNMSNKYSLPETLNYEEPEDRSSWRESGRNFLDSPSNFTKLPATVITEQSTFGDPLRGKLSISPVEKSLFSKYSRGLEAEKIYSQITSSRGHAGGDRSSSATYVAPAKQRSTNEYTHAEGISPSEWSSVGERGLTKRTVRSSSAVLNQGRDFAGTDNRSYGRPQAGQSKSGNSNLLLVTTILIILGLIIFLVVSINKSDVELIEDAAAEMSDFPKSNPASKDI